MAQHTVIPQKTKASEEMTSVLIRSLNITIDTRIHFLWLLDLPRDESQGLVDISRKVMCFRTQREVINLLFVLVEMEKSACRVSLPQNAKQFINLQGTATYYT